MVLTRGGRLDDLVHPHGHHETYARCTVAVIDQDSTDALDFLANEIRGKQCVLFLGAGVHAGPPEGSPFVYPAEHRPPIGKALSRELARRISLDERYPEEPD